MVEMDGEHVFTWLGGSDTSLLPEFTMVEKQNTVGWEAAILGTDEGAAATMCKQEKEEE